LCRALCRESLVAVLAGPGGCCAALCQQLCGIVCYTALLWLRVRLQKTFAIRAPLATTAPPNASASTILLCDFTVSPAPGKHRRQRSVDDTDTAELLILNSDFRAALVAALSGLDELEDGRLSIEQFAAILTQLIGVNGVSVVTLLMGR
jgi:hypothetical protein